MSQPLWHSIPYLCILLPLGSAAVTSVLKPRWARYWTMFVLLVVTSLSGVISAIFASGAESYTYMMGHFPAPWGNEIRAGQLEAVTALFFSLIMLLVDVVYAFVDPRIKAQYEGRKRRKSHA